MNSNKNIFVINPKYSNFNWDKWKPKNVVQRVGGSIAGSSAGLGIESAGILIGLPGAGTGVYTTGGGCAGDPNCRKKATGIFDKIGDFFKGKKDNQTADQSKYNQENYYETNYGNNSSDTKKFDYKRIALYGGIGVGIIVIMVILRKIF